MAIEIPVGPFNLQAAASVSQFRFVKPSGTYGCTTAAAVTDAPVGVSQAAAVTGAAVPLLALGVSKLTAGAQITVGDFVGTDGNGKAVPLVPGTDTTKYICGRALESAGADGVVFSAAINCATPHRAS